MAILDPALEASRSPRASEFIPLIDPSQIPRLADWLTPEKQAYYNARGSGLPFHALTPELRAMANQAGVKPSGDNSPEYDYLTQFYQLPKGHDDWLEMGGPALAGAFFGSAAGGLFSGAGGTGTAISGSAPLAGTVSAPVGTALATGAQEAAIADLVASGMSQEAATAAVMSGGESLSGVGTGLGFGNAAAAGTPLSRLLGMNQNQSDIASVLGTLGATGLGAYSANQQGNALENIAAQSRADRAPFLDASKKYLADPASYFEGPGMGAMNATLSGLSAKFGNPIGSGTALQLATGAGLQDWRNAVTGFANLGLAGEDTRAQLLSGAAQKDADVFTNIAGGASDLINPRRSLADLLREYKSVGLI